MGWSLRLDIAREEDMDPVIVELVQSAVEAVRSALPTILLGAAGSATWDAQKSVWLWMKEKLTASGYSQAVEQVEAQPDKDSKWEIVSAALKDLLSENPNLLNELEPLLGKPKTNTEVGQKANNNTNSKITQIAGNKNSVG